jgi:hypothetical protein
MSNSVSIKKFLSAISNLPSDEPVTTPGKWYRTQKEHWIGWLNEYAGPGAYNRQTHTARDARYAYNHIVEPRMLLWLIEAAGVDKDLVSQAKRDFSQGTSLMQQSAIIRRIVPWDTVATALWGSLQG